MDPSLLTTCRGMLMQATQLGERPLAYIMNPATQQHMTDLAAVEAMPKQSAFQRVLFRARKKHLILQIFCGVPILQNQFMPDGFVSLQFIPRGPQMPMPAGAPSVQAQANSAPGEWPFAKKEELRIQEAPADAAPTLDDLSRCTGDMPSVTDVLIKAVENADAVRHVAVLRIFNNGDVDASSNMDHTTLTGAIQKFQIWAMHHGER